MEDFRDIIGFLIIIIGIILSVLKEKKDKKSSDSSKPAQNTPILRKTSRAQGPRPAQPAQARTQSPSPQVQPTSATTSPSMPFVFTKVANKVRQSEQRNEATTNTTTTIGKELAPMAILPEEGVRVTSDIAPMDTITDYADQTQQQEEEFIEKLREGIILSEILKRKF